VSPTADGVVVGGGWGAGGPPLWPGLWWASTPRPASFRNERRSTGYTPGMNWTDEDADLVATYGTCEVCGGPRGMWLVEKPGTATQGLACVRHPEHGPDLRPPT
jgi:hypothetical protein